MTFPDVQFHLLPGLSSVRDSLITLFNGAIRARYVGSTPPSCIRTSEKILISTPKISILNDHYSPLTIFLQTAVTL